MLCNTACGRIREFQRCSVSSKIIANFVIVQHVLILRCMYVFMYVPMSVTLGPWGVYQVTCRVVTWFVPVHVSHGYMVCARARVAWLAIHGLPSPIALALPRVAGSASFNAVAFLASELCNCATRSHFALYVCVCICMYLCQSRLGPG